MNYKILVTNNKKNKFTIFILGICIVIFIAVLCVVTKDNTYSIKKPYDYPIDVGSEEFRALKSTQERMEAFWVPKEIVDNMTTAALIETVIGNPFIHDIYGYHAVPGGGYTDMGFEHVLARIDGLDEVTDREDFLKEMEKMERKASKMSEEDALGFTMDLEILYAVYEYKQK